MRHLQVHFSLLIASVVWGAAAHADDVIEVKTIGMELARDLARE